MWIKIVRFRRDKASYGELVRERIDGRWVPAWRDTAEQAATVDPCYAGARTEVVRLSDEFRGAYLQESDIVERKTND